ncbi:MAG: hypothetical protein JXR44_05740 [Thiotrichales bacterium]|nr:hypothetical protein [Thiotrichales bacterium]
MDNTLYKQHLQTLLQDLYQRKKNETATIEHLKIEGFMQAGQLGGIVSKSELEAEIDHAYQTVFGVNFSERNPSEKSWLNIPAYIRERTQN